MDGLKFVRATLLVGAAAMCVPTASAAVEDVKACSLYGVGFFFIPGTDVCLKTSGYARLDFGFNAWSDHVPYTGNVGTAGIPAVNTAETPKGTVTPRLGFGVDVRTQTGYGTLRFYMFNSVGMDIPWGGSSDRNEPQNRTQVSLLNERGFINFAGFTVGKAQSYFDLIRYQPDEIRPISYSVYGSSDSGRLGTLLASYTATFGDGFTTTISLEDSIIRRNAIWDASNDATNALVIGSVPGPQAVPGTAGVGYRPWTTLSYGSDPIELKIGDQNRDFGVPDVVGSLRVDQAWGSAQIAGALHQLRAGYYGNNTTGAGANVLGVNSAFIAPNDAYGWAAMAGIMINLPWAKGDKFYAGAAFCEGAGAYCGFDNSINGRSSLYYPFNGANVAAAWAMDSIFGTLVSTNGATGQQLTRYFSVTAALEHYWTPALRTSAFGSYSVADYNDIATTLFCSSPQSPIRRLGGAPPNGSTAVIGCNPDFNVWAVGTRTIWNPVPLLNIGVEVMYTQIDTKHDPEQIRLDFHGAAGRPVGLYIPANEGVWSSIIRLQRNFWP
jgi:hypothetical protein